MLQKRRSIQHIIATFSEKDSSPTETRHGNSKRILEENNEEVEVPKRIRQDTFSPTTR